MSTTAPALAILGTGHMGGAILSGIRQKQAAVSRIRTTTQSEQSATALDYPGVEVRSLEADSAANRWAVEGADVVILGVKPAAVRDVLADVHSAIPHQAVVVSVAAGVTIDQMATLWPGAIVRTMPNTPSAVGKGVTGIAVGPGVSAAQRESVLELFRSVGDVLVVDEEDINALSSISGSGPAFVYYVMECFLAAAREHGFSQQDARLMVEGTFRGALELLEQSGLTPELLREQVTSPRGSTYDALEVFRQADLEGIVLRATQAAIERARELGRS